MKLETLEKQSVAACQTTQQAQHAVQAAKSKARKAKLHFKQSKREAKQAKQTARKAKRALVEAEHAYEEAVAKAVVIERKLQKALKGRPRSDRPKAALARKPSRGKASMTTPPREAPKAGSLRSTRTSGRRPTEKPVATLKGRVSSSWQGRVRAQRNRDAKPAVPEPSVTEPAPVSPPTNTPAIP